MREAREVLSSPCKLFVTYRTQLQITSSTLTSMAHNGSALRTHVFRVKKSPLLTYFIHKHRSQGTLFMMLLFLTLRSATG